MALIQCPECGKQVSDKADKCPECGCPIAHTSNNIVSIKLGQIKETSLLQTVTISINGNEVWKGKSGDFAQLEINERCEVSIKYGLNIKYMPGTCTGIIDPSISTKYVVIAKHGVFYRTMLSFQAVDMYMVES